MLVQDYGTHHRDMFNDTDHSNLDKFFTEIWTSNSTNNTVIEVFGGETLGITNQIMYPISMSLSFFSGVKSVADYLTNGPMSIESDKTCCNIVILFAKWIYVMAEFLNKFVICWISSAIVGLVGGLILSFVLFILYVLFPALIVLAPITRYLGCKNFFKMYLNNPQLLTLPLITDFAFGPANGYDKCDCCCCCSNFCGMLWACFSCCCCCCCCCSACQFEKGTDITISKGSSWIKMIYTSLLLFLCFIIMCLKAIFEGSYYIYVILSYFGFLAIGRLAFIVILHCGVNKRFGTLSVVGTKINDFELNQIESKDESTSKLTTPKCNVETKENDA